MKDACNKLDSQNGEKIEKEGIKRGRKREIEGKREERRESERKEGKKRDSMKEKGNTKEEGRKGE